jgi:antirestriction protein ArdC
MANKVKKQQHVDVYQMVTDRVLEQIEQGIIPWHKPWNAATLSEDALAISYTSRKPYSFLNQMLLGRNGEWLTFNQVKERGCNIKKGAKAGIVVFYKQIQVTRTARVRNAEGEEHDKEVKCNIPVLKYYHVFHIEDCEGIESKIKVTEQPKENKQQPIKRAERVVKDYLTTQPLLKLHNDKPSNRAYYSPMWDEITVPMLSQYQEKEEYYSTLFHEMVHSTGHSTRLNREDGMGNKFGSHDYSREELVAELGSAMLCTNIKIDTEVAFKNSVAYIKGWASKLKEDTKAIVWAASRAEKAARYILGERENAK